MKKITSIVYSVIFIFFANTFVFASKTSRTLNIGVVDPIKVYKKVPQGQSSIDNLKINLSPKVKEFNKIQSNLLNEEKKLKINASTLTESELKKKNANLSLKKMDFNKNISLFKKDEINSEKNILNSFQAQLRSVIKKISQKNKYNLILSSQAFAYISSDIKVDITKEVIESMKKIYNS